MQGVHGAWSQTMGYFQQEIGPSDGACRFKHYTDTTALLLKNCQELLSRTRVATVQTASLLRLFQCLQQHDWWNITKHARVFRSTYDDWKCWCFMMLHQAHCLSKVTTRHNEASLLFSLTWKLHWWKTLGILERVATLSWGVMGLQVSIDSMLPTQSVLSSISKRGPPMRISESRCIGVSWPF